jgi:cytochrome c556
MKWCLVALCALTGQISAQVKPEDAVRYRQSAYTMVVWNFAPMGAMVRGKIPFDKAKFQRYAENLAALTPMLLEGFPKGSAVGNSEARPEIWQSWPDFQQKMKDFEQQSKLLADLAKAGDEAKTKAQFGKVGATCKACHDKYKKD